MTTQQDSAKNSSRIVLISIGIVMLAALVFFAWKYFSEKNDNDLKVAQIQELDTEILDLEQKIVDLERTLDEQGIELADKNNLLEQKNDQIKEMLRRLDEAVNSGKMDKGRAGQMEARLRQAQEFIERLQNQVNVLSAQKEALQQDVEALQKQKQQLQSKTEEQTAVIEEITQTNTELKKAAAVFKTRDFEIFNVKVNRSKSEDAIPGTRFSRAAMESLRVCFTILTNEYADVGPREVFMVIKDENEKTITNFKSAQSSGTFSLAEDGDEEPKDEDIITYSALSEFVYENEELQICIPFTPESQGKKNGKKSDRNEQPGKWEKGMYYISIYCERKFIGQGIFEIN